MNSTYSSEYDLTFIDSIPYAIGTSFDENNIDLELKHKLDAPRPKIEHYRSYRYSEVFLFGYLFESICYLHFLNDRLFTIYYSIDKKYFEFFKKSINEALPEGKRLKRDPHADYYSLEVYVKPVAISITPSKNDYFRFKISEAPSLPRIKKRS